MKKILGLLMPILLAMSSVAFAQNYSDIWWNDKESGWGLTLAHHNDQMFGVLFIYDVDGSPMWLTIPGGTFSGDGKVFSGDVYRTTAPPLGTSRWDASRVVNTKVGRATLSFLDEDNAALNYSVGEVQVAKAISRQRFGSWGTEYPLDSTDLWWNPKESGWGISVIEHGSIAFAVLYVHDAQGRPVWYVGPKSDRSVQGLSSKWLYWTWQFYSTRGTRFDRTWNAADLQVAPWGTLWFEIPMNVSGPAELRGHVPLREGVVGNPWNPFAPLERMTFGSPRTYRNKVVDTSPMPNAGDVARGAKITARFGLPLSNFVIGSASGNRGFFLFEGNTPVPGGARYIAGSAATSFDWNRTAEFYPASPLTPGKTYRASIVGQTSQDGSPVQDHEWSFTVAQAPDFGQSPFIYSGRFGIHAAIGLSGAEPSVRKVVNDSTVLFWLGSLLNGTVRIAGPTEVVLTGRAGVSRYAALANGAVSNPPEYYRAVVVDRATLLPKRFLGRMTTQPNFEAYTCASSLDKCYLGVWGSQPGTSYIEVFDVSTGATLGRLNRSDPNAFHVHATRIVVWERSLFAVMGQLNGVGQPELVRYDLVSGAETGRVPIPIIANKLFGDETSGRLWILGYSNATGDSGHRLMAIDGRNMVALATVAVGGSDSGEALAPGTKSVLVGTSERSNSALEVLEGDTLRMVQRTLVGRNVASICVERSGRRAWMAFAPADAGATPEIAEIAIEQGRVARIGNPMTVVYESGEYYDNSYSRLACIQ